MSIGELRGDHVHVSEPAEANRIYNKGAFGTPEPGNSLRLALPEAAYLVQQGRLRVEGVSFEELLRDEVAYLAYADLRERGLVVRPDGDSMAVWPRGQGPAQPASWHLHTASERDPLRTDLLAQWLGDVVGVVDEDGAVTHYAIEAAEPEGTVQAVDLTPQAGTVLADRVLAADAEPHVREFFGTPHGGGLVLSFTEAEALRRRGVLDVPDLTERARERQHHFDRTLPVYLDLRRRGVVAKSGFRFGTHLRGYRGDPGQGHAEWLIQCARGADSLHWSEVSRGVRLAHGVRKTFLLADADGPRYTALSWFRP